MTAELDFIPPPPDPGQIVRIRSRQYLVEGRTEPPAPDQSTVVRMSCLDDDAQGEPLEVLWEHEIDAEVLKATWDQLGKRDFDPPRLFASYLHTLRWSCVTATNPRLFQAPWRAGIEVMAYQLEPLRKALLMPRVNLFIADDVGLGKTIEAALVLREMIMRQRVRRVVVSAPASVVTQWKDELEQRFGLTFVIYDREFVARCRRERGYGVNPWTTHTRFIISHSLLRDEEYATPLRDWLTDFAPGAMLILDECHHAAPATSSKYAIDSLFTRAVRELSRRFEHRLFLSATPHNGLSNSFTALLEILDPQRFERGGEVVEKNLEAVMVRRLKQDLRETSEPFPIRRVVQVDLKDLPVDAPELKLSALLDKYWVLREERLAALPPAARATQQLVMVNLQKRLLSSIEAFARTLRAHSKAMRTLARGEKVSGEAKGDQQLLSSAPGADDDRALEDESAVEGEEEMTMEAATRAAGLKPTERELQLLAEMETLTETSRRLPDAKLRYLVEWVRRELCPALPAPGLPATGSEVWQPKRVLIFTEYADTKRYLEQQLNALVAGTDQGEARLRTFHGGMGDEDREDVKRAFNADPAKHPLRILIATDAAREGVNLQNHCADLFHFDLPWNPSRLEQRNGRIDRKLQRSPEVRCHYFLYSQREADRVLEVLAERTRAIQEDLGAVPAVLEEAMTHALARGIGPGKRMDLATLLRAKTAVPKSKVVEDELDRMRLRKKQLEKQLDELRGILDSSSKALDLNADELRTTLSSALSLVHGASPLARLPGADEGEEGMFSVPTLDKIRGADPTWADTMDTLRRPRTRGEHPADWRRDAPIRPVVFRDPGHIDNEVVHLHLEHRLVQRLLGRFLAQGFVLNDLSRACVGQTDDAVPRVLLLGRMSLFGAGASRLHDEIVVVAARWVAPDTRKSGLKAYAEQSREDAWELLLKSISGPSTHKVPPAVLARIRAATQGDVQELLPVLEERCNILAGRAEAKLTDRGQREAADMVAILESQRTRILAELTPKGLQTRFAGEGFDEQEARQLKENRDYWQRRLTQIAAERESEPARISSSYAVHARRIEPVGVAYLWPVTG